MKLEFMPLLLNISKKKKNSNITFEFYFEMQKCTENEILSNGRLETKNIILKNQMLFIAGTP